MARPRRDVAERFSECWMPEPFSGCWLWTGHAKETGYGVICWNLRPIRAHRLSWILFRGEIPKNLHVLHKCDTPSCVNPDHLFLGTHSDNMQDCLSKNRTARGIKSGRAKLSESDVKEIRLLQEGGMSYRVIARQFSVDQRTIYDAVNGRNWKYLCA